MTGDLRTRAVCGLIVLVGALVAGRFLFASGFHPAHDNLLNVHRVYQLEKCVADGQIPCRWVPDMGLGYGYPLFNFYPPLASGVALVPVVLGADAVGAVKAAFLFFLVLGAFGVFGLASSLYGPTGGAVAAWLWAWSPYVALDVFVRGALAELAGLAIAPFVFWSARELLRGESAAARIGWGLGCAAAWGALLQAHLLVAAMLVPVYALWCAACALRSRGVAMPRDFALAHALGIGLAAYFVLPALLERSAVHLGTLVDAEPWKRFENNFASWGELLLGTRPWGYAAYGAPDGMSVRAGALQWVAALAASAWVGLRVARQRDAGAEGDQGAALVLVCAGFAALALLLATRAALPLWEILPPLAYLQFPWRFAGLAALFLAVAGGALVAALPPRGAAGLAALLALAAAALGWETSQPERMVPVAGADLANERSAIGTRHGLLDFLPRAVDLDAIGAHRPEAPPPPAEPLRGVEILASSRSSDRVDVSARAAETPAVLRINSYRFPGWRVDIDGRPAALVEVGDPLGRMHVEIPEGEHRVTARFGSTPVRSVANAITLLAVALWLAQAWRGLAART